MAVWVRNCGYGASAPSDRVPDVGPLAGGGWAGAFWDVGMYQNQSCYIWEDEHPLTSYLGWTEGYQGFDTLPCVDWLLRIAVSPVSPTKLWVLQTNVAIKTRDWIHTFLSAFTRRNQPYNMFMGWNTRNCRCCAIWLVVWFMSYMFYSCLFQKYHGENMWKLMVPVHLKPPTKGGPSVKAAKSTRLWYVQFIWATLEIHSVW